MVGRGKKGALRRRAGGMAIRQLSGGARPLEFAARLDRARVQLTHTTVWTRLLAPEVLIHRCAFVRRDVYNLLAVATSHVHVIRLGHCRRSHSGVINSWRMPRPPSRAHSSPQDSSLGTDTARQCSPAESERRESNADMPPVQHSLHAGDEGGWAGHATCTTRVGGCAACHWMCCHDRRYGHGPVR